ncbi:tRNA (guanosine(46)-N(7))-methyltransferase TrmB [Litorivivens sp.]|uniref:tRNA (guanine(46)-N(7))-methyltransferase TrmB n=1 Tax=Litorivivens sp. TaxID=2020868 RepID=UPI0035658B48
MTSQTAKGNSVRAVTSNQSGIHDKLEEEVRKHLRSRFLKPYAEHNVTAFEHAGCWLEQQRKPLLLDSYCGTGESSVWLAQQHPDCAVIGIDKSSARLSKQKHLPENCLLVRADTDDIWRLAHDAGWQPRQHTLLYPNPWPKSEHLKRRIHTSPLFPTLLALGGKLELRTNWRIYAEEFCAALKIAEIPAHARKLEINQPITAFERKYAGAGQTLWQVAVRLSSPPLSPL